MRIGIDGGSWSNRRGYGRFIHEVARALSESSAEHEYILFLDQAGAEQFTPLNRFQIRTIAVSEQIGVAAASNSNRSLWDLGRMGRAVAKESLDVFFFPTVYSYFPLWSRVPNIVGIHDTIVDRNPHFGFSSKRHELFWKTKVKLAIWNATFVMTVSNYSKDCLQTVYRVPETKLRVVGEAASARFQPPASHAAREPFILYVGGISPNKNLSTLILAFEKSRAGLAGWRLLLAGDVAKDGFHSCYQELVDLIQERGLTQNVEFLGYVSDVDLGNIYQRAGLFVMPSLDEGFGLPAIEAMASGTPVITSTNPALTEVVGSAGIAVPAMDSEALAVQMNRLINDPGLRDRMSKEGIARAALFTWKQTASELIKIFEEAQA